MASLGHDHYWLAIEGQHPGQTSAPLRGVGVRGEGSHYLQSGSGRPHRFDIYGVAMCSNLLSRTACGRNLEEDGALQTRQTTSMAHSSLCGTGSPPLPLVGLAVRGFDQTTKVWSFPCGHPTSERASAGSLTADGLVPQAHCTRTYSYGYSVPCRVCSFRAVCALGRDVITTPIADLLQTGATSRWSRSQRPTQRE